MCLEDSYSVGVADFECFLCARACLHTQVKDLSLPPPFTHTHTPLPGLVAVLAASGVCVCLRDKGQFAQRAGAGKVLGGGGGGMCVLIWKDFLMVDCPRLGRFILPWNSALKYDQFRSINGADQSKEFQKYTYFDETSFNFMSQL